MKNSNYGNGKYWVCILSSVDWHSINSVKAHDDHIAATLLHQFIKLTSCKCEKEKPPDHLMRNVKKENVRKKMGERKCEKDNVRKRM